MNQPPGSAIVLTARQFGPVWLGSLHIRIFLDGRRLVGADHRPTRWGRHVIPVAPGPHRLRIDVGHLRVNRQFGEAERLLELAPGETVELEYRAPNWHTSRGALGPAPQAWLASGPIIGVWIGIAVVILLLAGFFVVSMVRVVLA